MKNGVKHGIIIFIIVGALIVTSAVFFNILNTGGNTGDNIVTTDTSFSDAGKVHEPPAQSADTAPSGETHKPKPSAKPSSKPSSKPSAKPTAVPTPTPTPTPKPTPTPAPRSFDHAGKNNDKHFFVPDSPYNDVTGVTRETLINVNNRLSKDYVPKDLVRVRDIVDTSVVQLNFDHTYGNKEAVEAFWEMIQAAEKDGVTGFYLRSVYRSYDTQIRLWNLRLSQNKNYGRERGVPLGSAYPGTSEHQTGYAFDITCLSSKEPSAAFAKTENYKWLKANSYKYGFILRYRSDKTDITGIKYEPYHYRYVGKELAKKLYKSGQTLEEYYGMPVAYE